MASRLRTRRVLPLRLRRGTVLKAMGFGLAGQRQADRVGAGGEDQPVVGDRQAVLGADRGIDIGRVRGKSGACRGHQS